MGIILTKEDYEIILHYYGIDTNNLLPNELQQKASRILETKLCKCINNIAYNKKKTKRKYGKLR